MTDITLGQPLGGFYWRGTIPGQLCGATVTWACTYESDEPIAIPPFVDYAGQHVIVTNQLPEGTDDPGIPTYVSPGTLTLTPTVTCPNDAGSPIDTILDPIVLVIESNVPPEPEGCPIENGDFETGALAPWEAPYLPWSIDTTDPQAGTYCARCQRNWGYLVQTFCGPGVVLDCTVQAWIFLSTEGSGCGVCDVYLRYLDGGGSNFDSFTTEVSGGTGYVAGWNYVTFTASVPAEAVDVTLEFNFPNGDNSHWNTNRVDSVQIAWG